MQFVSKFRIPALFCAVAVLVCELVARPYTTMGICDDGPYILMAQKLAVTGHIVYDGWAAAMIVLQLYFGAAFIKLFGFSFTTVRMSTLLVAMALAFVLQRTLVRSGINERNAAIGTLALVLSPLYLMLSVTFMSDIIGLFGIVLCLYGCIRALQSVTSRAAIAWLCFAVVANALCGTSRQIAWLGILVMVPSALWLLRPQRRVLLTGAAVNLAGALFVLACVEWLKHQPYIITVHLIPSSFHVVHVLDEFAHTFMDAPFLLLPLMGLFLPEIRKSRPRVLAGISALSLGYVLLAIHWRHSHPDLLLEPTQRDWVNAHGIYDLLDIKGTLPVYLTTQVRALLTVVAIGGVLGLIAIHLRSRETPTTTRPSTEVSKQQLYVLLAPFSIVYTLLLVPMAASQWLCDRYLLPLLALALIYLVRCYQERVRQRFPFAAILLVAITAIYGIVSTHNLFSFYRARAELAAELLAHGIPDTSVNSGWEEDLDVELRHADHTNDRRIEVPANAYVPPTPLPSDTCSMVYFYATPHIRPLYGVSFDPNACYGLAPVAPAHYSRWPYSEPGTLYIVHYTPPEKH